MSQKIAGLILAGGRSTRMGGVDKAFLPLAGRPLITHVLERARGQVDRVAISANGDLSRFAAYGPVILPDRLPLTSDGESWGPLAGILSGLEWARAIDPEIRWVASFAVDAPCFPGDLVAKMLTAVEEQAADLAMATSKGRLHPVFSLWPVAEAANLRTGLIDENLRAVLSFADRYKIAAVSWPDQEADPFFNVNSPADLETITKQFDPTA